MKKHAIRISVTFSFLLMGPCIADEYFIVEKKNVTHKFVKVDDPFVDRFTSKEFQNWENDTFNVFDRIKDKNAVAIDLGAWIGTTSIWLSKNFHHVIAVECDKVSLDHIKKNLRASECDNVSLCEQPITHTNQEVFFGSPKGLPLGESISRVKINTDSTTDFVVNSITLNELLHDYYFENNELCTHPIKFIKCDIEGGEEGILEDVLLYALNNNCQVFMSFHYSWWNKQNITDFTLLFKKFHVFNSKNTIVSAPALVIKRNPFISLLFTPK